MKFVYFGYDFMLESVLRLIREGHDLIGIFSFPCDNIFNFNARTKVLAQELDIPYSESKPLPIDIQAFIAQGCEVFLSAGYPYKIPPIPDNVYGINFHPSLLPMGRGIMPTPTILLKHPEASGVTLHKLTPGFDEGDILIQRALPLEPQDDVETLSSRIALCAPDLLSDSFKRLPELWGEAKPQDASKASVFPIPDEAMRTLDWKKTVDEIEATGRAFGRFGALARFQGKLWAVYTFKGWLEKHTYRPGDVACILSREIVIAAKDGFICLKDFQELPPE
jgi:methionyl-tRNA formyltransferase